MEKKVPERMSDERLAQIARDLDECEPMNVKAAAVADLKNAELRRLLYVEPLLARYEAALKEIAYMKVEDTDASAVMIYQGQRAIAREALSTKEREK